MYNYSQSAAACHLGDLQRKSPAAGQAGKKGEGRFGRRPRCLFPPGQGWRGPVNPSIGEDCLPLDTHTPSDSGSQGRGLRKQLPGQGRSHRLPQPLPSPCPGSPGARAPASLPVTASSASRPLGEASGPGCRCRSRTGGRAAAGTRGASG